MPLQPALHLSSKGQSLKISSASCESGRHSAISSSKVEIGGVVHATCRHCGCELMRLGASRRWFRTGQMGD